MIINPAQTVAPLTTKKTIELLKKNLRMRYYTLIIVREDSEDEYYDYDDSYSEEEDSDWKKKRRYNEYNKKKESDHDWLADITQRSIPPEIMQMRTTRIIQRNLVYLVGLPAETMTEEFLRSESMFGQYGNLLKVVKSRNDSSLSQSQSIVL